MEVQVMKTTFVENKIYVKNAFRSAKVTEL